MSDLSLEIVEGPNAGRRIAVSGPVVLGRAPDAGLVLDDEQVSRHHARVTPQGDGTAVVEDLGSTNGTFVNRVPVHGPARLVPGDDLLAGVTVVELRRVDAVIGQQSAVRPVPVLLAATPPAPVGLEGARGPGDEDALSDLRHLMDARTKLQARTAPLAVAVLVVLVVAVYLGSR